MSFIRTPLIRDSTVVVVNFVSPSVCRLWQLEAWVVMTNGKTVRIFPSITQIFPRIIYKAVTSIRHFEVFVALCDYNLFSNIIALEFF